MSTFCICRSTGHLWMPEKSYVYSLLYNLLPFGQPVFILHNQQSIYVNICAEAGTSYSLFTYDLHTAIRSQSENDILN